MLLFWLFGLYAAESAINLRNCMYLCVLWSYATSPARGVSKIKQEKRKKKKNPTNRGRCVGCDVAIVVDVQCKVVVLMGQMSS